MRGCVNLTRLTLSGQAPFGDVALTVVAVTLGKKLRGLTISGNENITDQSMTNLAEHCPKLREIWIANSPHITHVGIEYLVSKVFALAGAEKFGDIFTCVSSDQMNAAQQKELKDSCQYLELTEI